MTRYGQFQRVKTVRKISRACSLLMAFVLIFSLFTLPAAAQSTDPVPLARFTAGSGDYTLNGEQRTLSDSRDFPVIHEGQFFLPSATLARIFNVSREQMQKVIDKAIFSSIFRIGSQMDFFIPLREVSEYFGYRVELSGSSATIWPTVTTPTVPIDPAIIAFEQAMFELINTQRASRGLSRLTWNEEAAGIGRLWAGSSNPQGGWDELGIRQLRTVSQTDFTATYLLGLLTQDQFNRVVLNPEATTLGVGAFLITRNDGRIGVNYAIFLSTPTRSSAFSDPFRIEHLLARGMSHDEIITAWEDEIFRLTNVERVNHGLNALERYHALDEASRAHSEDMLTNNFLGHIGSDGSRATDRLRRTGTHVNFVPRENASSRSGTPHNIVQGWMNSPPHRSTVLSTAEYLGVGIAIEFHSHSSAVRATQLFWSK